MSTAPRLSPLAGPGQRHLLYQMVQFSRSLHAAGLTVNPAGLVDFARCLDWIDISSRAEFRAAARATLISGYPDIPVFEREFAAFWAVPAAAGEPEREDEGKRERPAGEARPIAAGRMLTAAGAEPPKRDEAAEEEPPAWSPDEILMHRDFALMSELELQRAQRLVTQLIALLANTASRRTAAARKREELDLRRMLRRNALRGADGWEFHYRRRKIRRTRLQLLCDVSGSMARYSRFLIPFIWAMRRQLARVDVAVFATRLTVITDLLRSRSIEHSLREVAAEARDWGGGTDIGACLAQFSDRFASATHRAQTVAIVLSDGWDRGDPQRMHAAMQRLRARVHRLLWLNPLLGHTGYQPLCQGMRTALPFIDHFLPAHNLDSFAGLLRRLRTMV